MVSGRMLYRLLRLTLAMAIHAENIIGAIQWTCGGPKLVQANPNKPIGRSGATRYVSVEDNRGTILTIE